MDTYLTDGLYAWDVILENGETRTLLSATVPIKFHSPVISAIRGPAYPAGPMPTVDSLDPPAAPIGGPNFTLHVHGTGFRVGDRILWNGAEEPTTVVSPTELTTGVNMGTATTPMAIPVAVRSLAGGTSAAVAFDLHPAETPEAARA